MIKKIKYSILLALLAFGTGTGHAEIPIAQEPLFAVATVPPVAMLNLSVDNQLFFNAFPEFADLTGNGEPENGYNHEFVYFGYFDSFKCYNYSTTANRFVPESVTSDKYCSGQWSGNFLNWLTMARIDTVRKILYGGYRSTDTATLTVLERTYLPNDAHSWVRFYDGDDLNRLTPFSLPNAAVITSSSNVTIARPPAGERNSTDHRRTFATPGWGSDQAQLGDQVEIKLESDSTVRMFGVIRQLSNAGAANASINVQITSSEASAALTDSIGPWVVTNHSRRGVSFCNTTIATGASQSVTQPPLLRVASGDYSLWTANERWQCRWENERRRLGTDRMRVGGETFSNGNNFTASGLWANAENPVRGVVALGSEDYTVRVEVCNSGLIGRENCRQYPNGNWKPIGLLQEFGDEGPLEFGLMTGSLTNHVSGGVLRKNISSFSDEIDQSTGQFLSPVDSIVRTLNTVRIFGYSHDSGEYTAGAENCVFGTSKTQMIGGRCFSWGNPQAEIFAESLRYLAGLTPTTSFNVTGTDRITGLTSAAWANPITPARYCTPKNIIQFNASVTSYDDAAPAAASDLPGIGLLDNWTNQVGTAEGIAGSQVFFGGTDGFCEAATLGSLSAFRGVCPEAPNQDGTYHIAGLAKYAAQADLRPTWQGTQSVRTIGVSLAPAVPRINIPRPGEREPAVVILPACDNQGDGLRCQLADFRIVEQDLDAGTGSFFIQWDVAEWGADFDMDINGTLSYSISGNEITVTTETWADSSGRATGFGYIISGTTLDGFHAHSGINGYNRIRVDAPSCNNCRVADAPTSWTFQLGTGTARLLREPLFYAAKYGGGNIDADGNPDNYFFAIDPSELEDALRAAFQKAADDLQGVTQTTSTARIDAGAVLFEARLTIDQSLSPPAPDWTGDVLARDPLAPDTDPPKWTASVATNWTGRNIVIGVPNAPVGDLAVSFTSALSGNALDTLMGGIDELHDDIGCTGVNSDNWYCEPNGDPLSPAALIDFLRGDMSKAVENGGRLRSRGTIFGTVVNSDTVLSLSRDLVDEGWGRLPDIGESYFEFVETKVDRLGDDEIPTPSKAAVLVGSNAGKLHAFSVETGVELFAYIPSQIVQRLYRQANPAFTPEPLVDGRFAVADAYIGGRWRTVMVGGLGGGAKGLYALDITEPENFTASNVLWELTPSDPGAGNVGHIFSAPIITRLEGGPFVAIFGNGVNSASESPELFVVNLETGAVIDSMEVPGIVNDDRLGSNGLMGAAIALSPATRSFVDRVYAGDLRGRLWRFRMDSEGVDSVGLFFEGEADQPITAPPTVAVRPQGGWDIYFGTGQFFAEGDNVVLPNNTEPRQSFYLVRDTDQASPRRRGDLGEARVSSEEVTGAVPIRGVEALTFQREGWFLDLVDEQQNRRGERVVRRANVGFGAVIFNTYEPVDDICEGGGLSRIYVLDTVTGEGLLLGLGDDAPEDAASVEIAGSAPIAPPILIRNVQVDPREPAQPVDPSDPDPTLPPLPSGDNLDRSTWCSQFGVRAEGVGFQPLGTVCDGRQIWRQIQ